MTDNYDILKIIKKKYPIHKYILEEDNNQPPQAALINVAIGDSNNLEDVVNSYLVFHKVHFHLKNYLMKLRKKKNGYKQEFIDIFYDIFLDNFIIIKELSNYFKDDYSSYINIWLDCFFINIFNQIFNDSSVKYHNIQPHLFFVIILFFALPEISKDFKEIPFSSILKLNRSAEQNWKNAIKKIIKINLNEINTSESIENVRFFIHTFLEINTVLEKKQIIFPEMERQKCISLIEMLIDKTDDMIKNIKKIRVNLLNNPI